MSNQDIPKALSDERHPLDESLGNIHELALRCAMIGQHDLGMILAKAHETIQQWVIQNEADVEELHELRKDKARLLWLLQNPVYVAYSNDGEDCWLHWSWDPNDEKRGPFNGPVFHDKYAAIDAAMEAK